jgi:hypothetical protein
VKFVKNLAYRRADRQFIDGRTYKYWIRKLQIWYQELEGILLRLYRGASDAANLLGGAHGFERARYDLARARSIPVVTRLGFEQLGVREDDPQLIVQSVKEETQFG